MLGLGAPEVFAPAPRDESAPVKKAKKGSAAAAIAAAAPPQGKNRQAKGPVAVPRFHMSPGMIILVILAILIPAAVFWAEEGPMKANAQWKEISAKAEDNIVGQMTRAIQHKFKEAGYDMTDIKFQPRATNAYFDEPPIMFKLPDSIHVQGDSTEGKFHGEFHPKTWRFEITAPVAGTDHTVTGSASEKDQSLAVDGKPITD